MSWDNIDFDTLVSGCITTGYQDGSPRVSLVDTLNYLIDALNEKIYATQFGQYPSFITEKFEKGAILFNSNFINNFNLLVTKYWQLWSAPDWYSSEALTDVVNYENYLLTDADLIAATSQEFYDLLKSGTFTERFSGEFFQNIKTLYGLMRYCRFVNKSTKYKDSRSGFIYAANYDASIANFIGAIANPARLKYQAECTAMNDPALGIHSIDTIQNTVYNGLLSNLVPYSQGYKIFDFRWESAFSMSDFYNARYSSCGYTRYFDETAIFINLKKYSTGEFLTDIPAKFIGSVAANNLRKVTTTAAVDGRETIIEDMLYDQSLGGYGFLFDAVNRYGNGTAYDPTYGYGVKFSRNKEVIQKEEFTQGPPAQVCQNTSGQLAGYSENHYLRLDLKNFALVDSNNIGLDYYIAPTP